VKTQVAGAGIAGLASAIALSKAGHDVEVAERASELREIGAALSLWPNAIAALDHLGLAEEIKARSIEAPTASIRSLTGKTLVRFDTEAMRRALHGLPVVILRADLQAVLLEECRRRGIEVRLSCEVRGVHLDRNKMIVDFNNEEAAFDAVIGADGFNSTVRAWVVGADHRRDCRRTAWRAVIVDGGGLIDQTWLTVGVSLQLIASPAPNGLAYWAADTPSGIRPEAGDPMLKQELHRLFDSWHQPIPAIIEATPPESLIINEIFDRPPPKKLTRGPVVLVGDAAHAMTPDLGQGACQGLEDAAVLLACADGNEDILDIFEAFERRRLRHVRTIVRDSYGIGRLATARRPTHARLRNGLVRITPEAMHSRRLARYASVSALDAQMTG
jgi:2-polyprenyl-6-methoxyphenol hydroxylase-like FAD-dependent oxidoreductase